MKFLLKKREQASVLVLTLVTCLVITTVLASYLALISSRYKLSVRSMGWNATMPILEAGIEEALTHLHNNTNNPTRDGWTAGYLGGQPVHTKRSRDFADGSYFKVVLYNATAVNPIIYSSGFVPAPLRQGYISRTVRVTTARPQLFPAAIAANLLIDLNGNSLVDSFNSCLGGYSTLTNRGTNGNIATNCRDRGAIDVGNCHVYGTATTGPGGTVTIKKTGGVGDIAWNAKKSPGIEPGWDDDDMNVAFPTNAPPTGPFLTPPVFSGIVTLGNNSYQMASFHGTSSTTNSMLVTGQAILYITGDLSLESDAYIRIQPGASLTLYIGGDSDLAGQGVINDTGVAANFAYIGLPSSTSLSYSGGSAFIGTMNAPQVDFRLSGHSEAYGAVIVKSYRSSGNGGLHYDECLGDSGGQLTISSWLEL